MLHLAQSLAPSWSIGLTRGADYFKGTWTPGATPPQMRSARAEAEVIPPGGLACQPSRGLGRPRGTGWAGWDTPGAAVELQGTDWSTTPPRGTGRGPGRRRALLSVGHPRALYHLRHLPGRSGPAHRHPRLRWQESRRAGVGRVTTTAAGTTPDRLPQCRGPGSAGCLASVASCHAQPRSALKAARLAGNSPPVRSASSALPRPESK